MKKVFSTLFGMAVLSLTLTGQATFERVYQVLQQKCVQCHNHSDPAGMLDLEGSGATVNQKMADVYDKLFMATPENDHAESKGYKYIYPGRADKSFLFRKINGNMEPSIQLEAGENQPMPAYGALEQLTIEEKELIRQWVLFGAPENQQVVDENLIHDYYNTNGIAGFPDGPPPAPDASEGFQIKVGPFYIEPGGEKEFFQKYEIELPDDVDVDRVDIIIPSFSHHFIIYNFNPGGDASIPHGLRLEADHSDISLVAAVQESTDLQLPQGSAFIWDQNLVLDLNSHTINYAGANTYQAEAYINVYTQPAGTAAQEMHTSLIVNSDIYIPNTGDEITHTQDVYSNTGDVYVWGVMGHVHKYGTGYKVYERMPGGVQGELIYDAACANGVPGCVSPYFDYQHIPMRYFEPLREVSFDSQHGFIHEATWVNDGPAPVWWGPTSADEMMVMVVMYLLSTDGVVTDTDFPVETLEGVQVFPNPVEENFSIKLPPSVEKADLTLFDVFGREIITYRDIDQSLVNLNRNGVAAGVYYYVLKEDKGRMASGKIVFK